MAGTIAGKRTVVKICLTFFLTIGVALAIVRSTLEPEEGGAMRGNTPPGAETDRRWVLWTDRIGLGALALFTVVAVAGFATFGQNPALLLRYPGALEFYPVAFRLFSIGQIVLAGAVLALFLLLRAGLRWIPALAAVYLLSLGAELSGTAFGVPFGEYAYGTELGPRWLGLVPLVIPLSWFTMALPSWALARRALGGRPVATIVLAALLLTAWDLALDPAMSRATFYWRWGVEGAYYGMPWVNLAGWFVTGLALMGALHALRAHLWTDGLPLRWLTLYYGINLALPLGMAVAAGMYGVVPVTLAAYLALGGGVALLRRRDGATAGLAGRSEPAGEPAPS
jgi:uncharacterized membrane protein